MKRNSFLPVIFSSLFLCVQPLLAQDSPAAAAAEREEREANFKRMNTLVEQMQDTMQAQSRDINKLVAEVHNLREQVERLKNKAESTATQEVMKQLAEKIEEVDKKRQKDNELVYKKISALGKELSTTLVPKEPTPAPRVTEKPTVTPPTPPENMLAYPIKDGDTLSRIVTDLRAQNVKITQKQMMDANPKVNWNKLRIGQTVFIPVPAH